jgi:hypothetical protein
MCCSVRGPGRACTPWCVGALTKDSVPLVGGVQFQVCLPVVVTEAASDIIDEARKVTMCHVQPLATLHLTNRVDE